MKIKAERIFLENEILEGGLLEVENERITGIGDDCGEAELSCHTLLPGFIDIHVHGGNGYDTMDLTYEAINEISKYKLKEGVTAFCPTTVTTSIEKTKSAIRNVDAAKEKGVDGAEIIGVFLEGPYINEKYKGAHPAEFIREIDVKEIEDLISAGKNIKSIVIAPEKENALEAIKMLREKKINVRLGHTAADSATADKAVRLGANIAVHTFNAMSPFTHREPGMAGCALYNGGVYAELINDFVHVNPKAAEVLYKAKGAEKVVLVTDCMMAGGLPDGQYNLGELPVEVKDKIARTSTGALAGSTLTLYDAVKNMLKIGVSLFDAVKMASLTPAKALGIDNEYGGLAIGKKAGIIGMDENLNIKFVLVNGNVRYAPN